MEYLKYCSEKEPNLIDNISCIRSRGYNHTDFTIHTCIKSAVMFAKNLDLYNLDNIDRTVFEQDGVYADGLNHPEGDSESGTLCLCRSLPTIRNHPSTDRHSKEYYLKLLIIRAHLCSLNRHLVHGYDDVCEEIFGEFSDPWIFMRHYFEKKRALKYRYRTITYSNGNAFRTSPDEDKIFDEEIDYLIKCVDIEKWMDIEQIGVYQNVYFTYKLFVTELKDEDDNDVNRQLLDINTSKFPIDKPLRM